MSPSILAVEPSAISFFVAGDPKGQPRPRAFAMNMGGGKFSARVFDSGTAEGWKSLIASAARPHVPAAPMLGPVRVYASFTFARPKAHYRGGKFTALIREDAPAWHLAKPDADNCIKALLDALTQMGGFWRDDSQVCVCEARKLYGAIPGVQVDIRALISK
jgi:Holliday junction resolvase RusA-like endonuclease